MFAHLFSYFDDAPNGQKHVAYWIRIRLYRFSYLTKINDETWYLVEGGAMQLRSTEMVLDIP